MNKQSDKLSFSPLGALLPAAALMICGTLLADVAAAGGLYPWSERVAVQEAVQLNPRPNPVATVSRVKPFNYLPATSTAVSIDSLNDQPAVQLFAKPATRHMAVISYRLSDGKVVSAELIQVPVGAESS